MALIFLQALALTAFFVNRALGTDFLFLSAPPIGTPLVWIGSAGYGVYIACLQGMMTLLCLAMDGAGRQLFGGKYRPPIFLLYKNQKMLYNKTEYRTYCAIF